MNNKSTIAILSSIFLLFAFLTRGETLSLFAFLLAGIGFIHIMFFNLAVVEQVKEEVTDYFIDLFESQKENVEEYVAKLKDSIKAEIMSDVVGDMRGKK